MTGPPATDAAWLTRAALLSLRLGVVVLATPLLAAARVPATARVLFVLGLAAALALALPAPEGGAVAVPPLDRPAALLTGALSELALGATLALGAALAFGAFTLAGRLLSVQIGFGLAEAIDPTTGARVPTLASAYDQAAVLGFLLADGHHALLRGLAYSLERFPPGAPWPLGSAFAPVLRQVAGLFSLGFALAAPVVFCLLLVELALGVVARNLPQMNMLAVGLPAKVVVGLLALSLWFGGVGAVMGRVYAGIYRTWDEIFSLARAPAAGGARLALRPPLARAAAGRGEAG